MNPDTTRRIVVIDTGAHRQIAELRHQVSLLTARQGIDASTGHRVTTGLQSPKPPVFSLPITAKGELVGDASTLLASGCPAKLQQPGNTVAVTTSTRAETDASDYSPLLVRLLKPQSNNSVLQLSEKKVSLGSSNVVAVRLPDNPGKYQIEFGVYRLSELTKEYPTFFRRTCEIVIA